MHKIFILSLEINWKLLLLPGVIVLVRCAVPVLPRPKTSKHVLLLRSLVLDLKDASNKYLLYLHRFNFIYIYGTANI